MRSSVRNHCLVPTCKPHKLGADNRCYVGLPKDPEIRKSWFKAIKVKDEHQNKRYRVCSLHFDPSDFERDLYSELLGLDRRKKVKPDAVPWLFLPGEDFEETPTEDKCSTSSEARGDSAQVVDNSDVLESESTPTSISENVKRRSAKGINSRPKVIEPPPPPVGCLLCCKFPVIKNYSHKYKLPGSNNFEPLNQQLWHIFTLEKVLGITSSKCRSLIEKYGKSHHPSNWFHLCNICAGVVAKIMNVYGQLISLELQMKTLKSRLNRKVTNSLKTYSDQKLEQNKIEVEIRDTLRELNGIPPRVRIKTEPIEIEGGTPALAEVEDNEPILKTATGESSGITPRQSLSDRIDSLMKRNTSLLTQNTKAAATYIQRRQTGILPRVIATPSPSYSTSVAVPLATTSASSQPVIPTYLLFQVENSDNPTKPSSPIKNTSRIKSLNILRKARAFRSQTTTPKLDHEKSDANETDLIMDEDEVEIIEPQFEAKKQRLSKDGPIPANRTMLNEVQAGITSVVNNVIPVPNRRRKQMMIVHKYINCSRCKSKFTQMFYEEHMKKHEKSDKMDNEFDCPTCSFPYDNALSLERHRKSTHVEKQEKETKKKVCEICGLTVSKTKLNGHMLNHKVEEFKMTDSDQFGCTLCDKNFPTKTKLIHHKRSEHILELGLDTYLCTHCGKMLLSKTSLDIHIKTQHLNPKLKPEMETNCCDTCGKEFSNRKSLHEHRLQDHDGKCYVCDKCGGEYSTLNGLKDHQNKYYGEHKKPESTTTEVTHRHMGSGRSGRRPVNKKPQICKYCQITLPHFAALVHHLKTHAKFKCSICNKMLMSQDNLIKHQKMAHATENTKSNCRFCNKEFKHKNNVFGHYQYCKGISNSMYKVYCENCNRGFRHKLGYNVHKHYCTKKVPSEETEAEKSN